MTQFNQAQTLLSEFKGDTYLHGVGILRQTGNFCKPLGRRAAIVGARFNESADYIKTVSASLIDAGIEIIADIPGARPNAPREDLFRITEAIKKKQPDMLISFGGGSTIDATKAANVLATLGGDIDIYFGTGKVSEKLAENGMSLLPHLAIQTAASSGAHLTKYTNITDISTGQKKLIVDEAIVPDRCVFDYEVTFRAPKVLTLDGAIDGFSHSLEVLYGAVNNPNYPQIEKIASESIRLIVEYLPILAEKPEDPVAREAVALGTDLGGYIIMCGGTNGAHLTSFSLVDILSHGRACGMMNPYYTVFFAPEIERALIMVGEIFNAAGYSNIPVHSKKGRELGLAVAQAMLLFSEKIGLPTTLQEIPGFEQKHIERALNAAKDPQLKMKLENMPVALTVDTVDRYMKPILNAAQSGDLSLIKNA
jgi:alcohol dehydrogenase